MRNQIAMNSLKKNGGYFMSRLPAQGNGYHYRHIAKGFDGEDMKIWNRQDSLME